MSVILDELHAVIADLEAEGHHLASRFRDVAERIKADVTHLTGAGQSELDALVQLLLTAVGPELDRLKAQGVADAKSFLSDALAAVEPVVAAGTTDAQKVFGDIVAALRSFLGGTPAPAPTPAPEPVPAPAQG